MAGYCTGSLPATDAKWQRDGPQVGLEQHEIGCRQRIHDGVALLLCGARNILPSTWRPASMRFLGAAGLELQHLPRGRYARTGWYPSV